MSESEELCYERCGRTGNACSSRACRYWISHPGSMNCTLIATASGPMTLQQIGEIIGVTRMRVCQLEKRILDDIRHDKDIRRAN